MGDALVRVAFEAERVHWDVVFQYSRDDQKHVQDRRLFEYSLLLEGLVLEREIDLDGTGYAFLKVLCPFAKLALEAEQIRLRLPLKVCIC